jgi:hypothetical protein
MHPVTSRRTFLGQLTSLPILSHYSKPLHLFALPGMKSRAAMLAEDQPQFSHPQIIRYDSQCFTIHGQDRFLYSASFHYCRCPRELWRDRMLKLKLAGINTIETYVFWNYHEPMEGRADMTELEAFITLVKEMGLWMILRIGPYACAEWDAGGFPHWIIAQQFPLRSDAPESIKTSQGWYDLVLPIARKNMITEDGPVILVQIENEYDFWPLPAAQKVKYITALANMAWKRGINVPLITNWCRQTRDDSNPLMARITDTCDFYPRWNIQKQITPELAKLRKQKPMSPLGVAELQGGWFSQYGGKLSVDQPGVDAAQLNLLTKSVIEQGVSFANFYMGFGGTNFQWAARLITTSYDYAAPLREPGGLWSKYYAARLIGSFLDQFGSMTVRAGEAESAVSTHPGVSVSLRRSRQSGVLFVRENANADQKFQLKFPDPAGENGQQITIPSQGKLAISARGMKLLPVQIPVCGEQLRYSSVEFLACGRLGDRDVLFVYGAPGELAEIALLAEQEPQIQGAVLYQSFDAETRTAIFATTVGMSPQMFLWNGKLQIVVLPRRLAGRAWMVEQPSSGADRRIDAAVLTDCALMSASQADQSRAAMTLEYVEGDHPLCVLTARQPVAFLVDGKPAKFEYDPLWRRCQVEISTPQLPCRPVALNTGEFLVERFDLAQGEWLNTAPTVLEKLGGLPYGYVKYRAAFEYRNQSRLYLETQTEDPKQVFLNGHRIPELSSPEKLVSCELDHWAKKGTNLLEISYEAFGSPNGGSAMAEMKGITSIRLGDQRSSSAIDKVAIQRFPSAPLTTPHRAVPSQEWRPGRPGQPDGAADLVPAYTWFRAAFPLRGSAEHFCPWKLRVDADRDALLYVNGRFAGYYQAAGPQSEFYMPEPWLHLDGTTDNVVAVMLAYTDGLRPLKELLISPYEEFATRKTQVEMRWT